MPGFYTWRIIKGVEEQIVEEIISDLYLTSDDFISVNHYIAYRAVMSHGKPLATGYCTKEAKKYKQAFADHVREEVKRQGYNLKPTKEQHFYVDCVFYFPMLRMDCNNYFKCMLDAITDTQLVWIDDNVVCERVQRIYYDSKSPRIELHIHPVDYIGIFDNMSQLDEFISNNCVVCNRHNRNCSILAKAKAGKIQEEIKDMECLKRNGENNNGK